MKTTVDIKSVMVGVAIGMAAMFTLGAGTNSKEIGRYQVSAGTQGCAVIVDTTTGQAWGFQPTSTAQWRNDDDFWKAK